MNSDSKNCSNFVFYIYIVSSTWSARSTTMHSFCENSWESSPRNLTVLMEVSFNKGEDDTKSVIKAFIRTEPTIVSLGNANTTVTTTSTEYNSSIQSNDICTVQRIHDQHMRILKSPLFESCGPKIVDSIFTLDKFPLQVAIESRNAVNSDHNCDEIDSQSLIPTLKSATGPLRRSLSKEVSCDNDHGFYLTTFESVLIVINILLIETIYF